MYTRNVVMSAYKSNINNFHFVRSGVPSEELSPHIHDFFQIIYCRQGSLTHTVNLETAKLFRGDIFIVPPNTPHHISSCDKDTIINQISFKYEFIAASCAPLEMSCKFLKNLSIHGIIMPRISPMSEDIYLFESTVGKIRIEFINNRPGREEIIRSCLLTLTTIISRMYIWNGSSIVTLLDNKQQRINNCIAYIDSRYYENISLEQISKMAALSVPTFCDMFKSTTGLSFKDYLNKKRIEKAKSLLACGEGITEAAYICGYNDFSTFYRNFVKFTGMMPSEFKKQCENKK